MPVYSRFYISYLAPVRLRHQQRQEQTLTPREISAAVVVDGGVKTTTFDLRFRSPSGTSIENGELQAVLGDGLDAVTGGTIRINARLLQFGVLPQETAQSKYDSAVREGRTAALVKSVQADVTSVNLGQIPADAEIVVTLHTVGLVSTDLSSKPVLRVQKSFGSRYGASSTAQKPSNLADAPAGMSISVVYNAPPGCTVTGYTVAPAVSGATPTFVAIKDGKATRFGVNFTCGSPHVTSDRDFIMTVDLRLGEGMQTVLPAVITTPQKNGKHALVATFTAPKPADAQEVLPPTKKKQTPFVCMVDVSGSMDDRIDELRAAVKAVINCVPDGQPVCFCTFDDRVSFHNYKKEFFVMDDSIRADLLKWAGRLRTGGGTEMFEALKTVREVTKDLEKVRFLVLTDAEIGEYEANDILGARRAWSNTNIFVIGVGKGIKFATCDQIAHCFNGVAQYTHGVVYNGNEAADEQANERMPALASRMLQRMDWPVTLLHVDWVEDDTGKRVSLESIGKPDDCYTSWDIDAPVSVSVVPGDASAVGILNLPLKPARMQVTNVASGVSVVWAVAAAPGLTHDDVDPAVVSKLAAVLIATYASNHKPENAYAIRWKVCLQEEVLWRDVTALYVEDPSAVVQPVQRRDEGFSYESCGGNGGPIGIYLSMTNNCSSSRGGQTKGAATATYGGGPLRAMGGMAKSRCVVVPESCGRSRGPTNESIGMACGMACGAPAASAASRYRCDDEEEESDTGFDLFGKITSAGDREECMTLTPHHSSGNAGLDEETYTLLDEVMKEQQTNGSWLAGQVGKIGTADMTPEQMTLAVLQAIRQAVRDEGLLNEAQKAAISRAFYFLQRQKVTWSTELSFDFV